MTSRAKVLLLVGALGCGGRSAAPGDAGAPPASGVLSFDVTAFLTPSKDGGAFGVPPSHAFTLTLDVEAGQVIAGGRGHGGVAPVTTDDGRTFTSKGAFAVGFSSGAACAGVSELSFQTFELTVTGKELQGTATGMAPISCGDCFFNEPFTATLVGVADATPPFLVGGVMGTTPFDGFSVLTSEALPPTAKARLVADDGSALDLDPVFIEGEGAPPTIIAFLEPQAVLRPGQGYTISSEGLVDFVGHPGSPAAPLRLTTFPLAPLVSEDGFESAVGATVGGATLIRGSGPLHPLTGIASAFVGGAGSPKPGGIVAGPALTVRLALQPGDTKLRFGYRVVASLGGAPFGGTVNLGSVGRTPSAYNQLPAVTETESQDWGGGPGFLSPLVTAELDLPADAQGELLVSIAVNEGGCGQFLSPAGLLVDDLRVE